MRQHYPIDLIAETYTQDELGVPRATETKVRIFAEITSVSSAEWFEGGRAGLNPEFRAEVYSFEYSGQKILEKDGIRYAIYRTYQKSMERIELYCELKKGSE
jgi:hypothetical protein